MATGVNLVSGKLGNKCINLREYMKAVVDAVRFCHELKIVHRDIKVYINWTQPENLLITSNGPDATLKLADFGISKILS